MKKIYFILCLICLSTLTFAQEVIVGGDMTDEESWIGFWRSDAPDEGSMVFNYGNDKPTSGEGGCLNVYGFGQTGMLIFQPVTIIPGHTYSFTGAFKSNSPETLTATWVELILSDTRPDDEAKKDYGAGPGDYIYAMNSWMTAPYNDMAIDGTFQDNFQFTWKKGGSDGTDVNLTGSSELTIPDTVTITEWWVSFKAGCWNTAGEEVAPFDFLVDDISLVDLGGEVGINLLAKKNTLFSISPNSSNGIITLNFKPAVQYSYNIFDNAGRMVKSGKSKGNSTIEIAGLNRGLYVVSVKAGNQSATQKVSIQ